MEINLIFAQGIDGAFGLDKGMPWKAPTDLAYFKHMTKEHAVLMGKNTWYSLPGQHRPLQDRLNIVMSQELAARAAKPFLYAQDTERPDSKELIFVRTFTEAVKKAASQRYTKLFVIGGPALLREAFSYADHVYQTVIDYDGPFDVKAPDLNLSKDFKFDNAVPSSYSFAKSPRDEYGVRFLTWTRKNKMSKLSV